MNSTSVEVKLRPNKNDATTPAKGARNINRMKMEDSPYVRLVFVDFLP